MKTILLAAPFLLATSARAQNITFPASSGVLNVRDAKYGARGDGKADDTAAIQKALTEALSTHRVIYLPNGTYLVSDTLKWQNAADAGNKVQGWGPFLQLQGQSRARTIIRLRDSAAGFGDEDAPRAVLQTGSSGAHGGKTYRNGEGNEAFENHLRDFSVQTGSGNAGAIGIDFQASNCGAMRHVSISGAGYAGISLARRDNGPALLKDISVQGFRFGIRTSQEIAHFTLEDIQLRNQTEAGIWMRDSVVAARHISSQSAAPAIQMAGTSLLALFDSDLKGEGAAAIACQGSEPRLFVRNLATSGYAASVRARGESQKPILSEWSSDAPVGAGAAGGKLSLGLAIRDTPEWYEADPSRWADAGAPSGGDDTAQVQAALNSGKAFVMFRAGRYRVSQTLVVPPTVRRLQGVGSILQTTKKLDDGQPLLRLVGGAAANLTIVDRFELGSSDGLLFEHVDARTVVLSDLIIFGGRAYRNQKGAGPLFVEDVACGGWEFAPGTQAWARQWNIEGGGGPVVLNDGAQVWALGWKTEGGSNIVENRNGGRMELWAGLAYTFGVPADRPAIINEDASLSAQFAGTTYMGPGGYYDLLVRDTQRGQVRETRRAQAIGRGGGATLPLYLSVAGAAPISAQENSMKKTAIAAVAASTWAQPARLGAPAAAQAGASPAAQAAAAGKVYKAPEFLDGDKKGEAAGNPLEVGGRPLWRLDQIWPDDVMNHDNYKPMPWAGDSWRGAYEFGGQPAAKVEAGKFTLGVRGGWAGDGAMPGSKLAAISFIAPARGHYTMTGTVRAGVWQGEAKDVSLSILTFDPAAKKVSRLRSIPTPKDTDVALEEIEADLEAGQELIIAPQVAAMYTAANFEISNLKIQLGAAAAAAVQELKAGQSVTIGGRSYKVEKVEGKTITLRAE